MDTNLVVLILGALVLAFATYFTRVVLRRSGGTMEATVGHEGMRFKVSANDRSLAVGDARAASLQKGLTPDDDRAGDLLRDVGELRFARALWVDDNPVGNVHERRMLERLNVDIDLARSTDEAFEYLVGRRYHVIITDLTRPDATGQPDRSAGLDFLRMLANGPSVPPIIVYAGKEDDRARVALGYGARAFTTTPSALLEAVVEVLAAK